MKYPVAKPNVSGNERKYLNECIDTGWISSGGAFVEKLEQQFAIFNCTKHCVACSSGTTALTLALRALDIGPGDEVIVPDFTMIASAWAVTYTGATPVFVDCGDDLNIDVTKIEGNITPRTRAIMPVHIYGRLCDMDSIMDIARRYNLRVVEDACEVQGAIPVERGDIQCYSLFANKIISSGEGGLITTNDSRLNWQLRHLRSMAFDPDHSFLHSKLGYNFRISNLQAAVGLAQVERLSEFLKKRKKIESWYDTHLEHLTVGPRDVLWVYDIVVRNRDKVMGQLADKGVESRMFFKPMTTQPMYDIEEIDPGHSFFSNAFQFSKKGLYLPTYVDLTEEDVDYISKNVLEVLS